MLRYVLLLSGGSSPEDIEIDLKPLVDFGMYLVVLVTEFSWRNFLLQSFGFRSCSVFIGAANKQRCSSPCFVVPMQSQLEHIVFIEVRIPRENVGAQNTPHNVPKVGHWTKF